MKKRFFWALWSLSLGLAACSGTKTLDSPNAGRTVTYEIGVPNFDMEAVPTWRNDQAGLDLYLALPHRSLIFLQNGTGVFQARYDIAARILDEKGKTTIREESFTDVISVYDYNLTQTLDALNIQQRYPLTPGTYVIETVVTDLNSKKDATRRQRVNIPDLNSGNLSLSRILLEGHKPGRTFAPIVAYHTSADVDSMRATVEVYNADAAPYVQAKMMLRALPTDLRPADPPFWYMPNTGSIGYQGVQYSKGDTIQTVVKDVRNVSSELVIEFNLPKLRAGMYRLDILVAAPPKTNGEQPVLLRERRDLSIKANGFPRMETIQQLIEPLSYIAYKKDLQHIIGAQNVQDLKDRFDAFWGERMPSKQAGINTIKEFYSRVEQANLMFTTYKEGWKTDPGMVYIIMGAPQQVEEQLDVEVWRYSYNSRDPLSTFTFQKIRPYEGDFINYILVRSPYFEQEWLRQVERWRTGSVF